MKKLNLIIKDLFKIYSPMINYPWVFDLFDGLLILTAILLLINKNKKNDKKIKAVTLTMLLEGLVILFTQVVIIVVKENYTLFTLKMVVAGLLVIYTILLLIDIVLVTISEDFDIKVLLNKIKAVIVLACAKTKEVFTLISNKVKGIFTLLFSKTKTTSKKKIKRTNIFKKFKELFKCEESIDEFLEKYSISINKKEVMEYELKETKAFAVTAVEMINIALVNKNYKEVLKLVKHLNKSELACIGNTPYFYYLSSYIERLYADAKNKDALAIIETIYKYLIKTYKTSEPDTKEFIINEFVNINDCLQIKRKPALKELLIKYQYKLLKGYKGSNQSVFDFNEKDIKKYIK